GRLPHGFKGTLTEGGSRVPLIASWPGVTPAGAVSPALIDFTDFYATFAQVAGAPLPASLTIDSRSFAPLLRSPGGSVRSWLFVQLGNDWYARDNRWKLTGRGELLDLSDAPFT